MKSKKENEDKEKIWDFRLVISNFDFQHQNIN